MSEKQIQREIVQFLELVGYHVSDFSQPRATMQTPGVPDLHAMYGGHRAGTPHAVWIEVKTPQGRLSLIQQSWHAQARAAGETVIVARCCADLVEPLSALGAPIHA